MHICHAPKCTSRIPPKMFMCKTHWYMLSQPARSYIWAAYEDGQEIRKDPSEWYIFVSDVAQALVGFKDGVLSVNQADRAVNTALQRAVNDGIEFNTALKAAKQMGTLEVTLARSPV